MYKEYIKTRPIAPLVGVVIVLVSAATVISAIARENRLAAKSGIVATPVMGAPMPAEYVAPPEPERELLSYIAITESCGAGYDGACVRARSGPGTDYGIVAQLRKGMVLRVIGSTVRDGRTWYKVGFDEWLRYPDRARSMYIAADFVSPFTDYGPEELTASSTATHKSILVDRSSQMLYAYDGTELFMKTHVSTGIEKTPTPRGTFTVYYKTPSRYMQGPIPGISTKEYDLPGVPWNLYFTKQGAVIHGAYWHNDFGSPHSNGCVNLSYDDAKKLYAWADVGTKVVVRD